MTIIPLFLSLTTTSRKPSLPSPVVFFLTFHIPRTLSRPLRRISFPPPPSVVTTDKEYMETELAPPSFLCESDKSSSSPVRSRFEKMIREVREKVCDSIKKADGVRKFKKDVWFRPGGGGINRVLQDGGVCEKVGGNVSVVYDIMPQEAYIAAKGTMPPPIKSLARSFSAVRV